MKNRHCATCTCTVSAERPPARKGPCEGFQWIGQSFASCDRCGLPYWEHAHDERLREGGGPFDAQFDLVPITPEMAESCRRKWSRQP